MINEKIRPVIHLFLISVLTFFVFSIPLETVHAQEINPDLYKQLKYRFIGPQGNRVIAVAGIPGDPLVYYAGAASGGIFKSTDGGINWKPIFDDQPVSSIGSLAIAPSDPNIVWAGTGETFIRFGISQGNGIYKTTDAGKTWKCMGLEKTGRIGRVVINPHDPNIVYAAAMGHCYGPQQERGVFRTVNGGETWEKVLFVDENTGCSDIVMDPNNPRILFAGMWPMLIKTWGRWSGGPGGGLYVSRDSGTTWKRITEHGLPKTIIGKVGVAVAPNNSDRVYALIETEDEGLWRSDDGGENWKHVNHDHSLLNRTHYYTRCIVAPDNHNEVFFPASAFHMTLDGGETIKKFKVIGGDHHDMWIDPLMPNRMVVGNDHVVCISLNRGKSWHGIRLPIAQMYHVSVDNNIPYYVYGNQQDEYAFRGPSNSLIKGGISSDMWHIVGDSETGQTYPDTVDNNTIWSGNFDGLLDRYELKTGHTQAVTVWPLSIQFWEAAEAKYRFQWTFPIAISPHNHNKVFVGSQFVHQTTNGGNSWKIISPDLSTNDKSKQQRTGGLTPDDDYYYCTVFAIAESPLEEGVIWAGTNDGLLQITRDGGENWINVTENIPNLPEWGTISNIEPSRYDGGTCYITVDFHEVNNRDPFVYKITEYGKRGKLISSDIPKSELSYAHCVREDPVRKGMLYLGTENALYVSWNDGAKWYPLQNNLPHAPVRWLTIQNNFNDLVVGTYGRGFYILDDLGPLQQLTPEVLKSDVHLFEPRPAYRFRKIGPHVIGPHVTGPYDIATHVDYRPNDQCLGKNPDYGASINYYLKSAPKDSLKIVILDQNNQPIRTLNTTKKPGINRISWDLRYDQLKEVKLRTSPVDAPYVKIGEKGWRALGRGSREGPLAAPGTYTVRLSVSDQEFEQQVIVKKDPNSAGNEMDMQAQVEVLLNISDEINSVVDMINQIEWLRKQIDDFQAVLKEDQSTQPILSASEEFEKKLIVMQDNFYNTKLTYNSDSRWRERFYVRYCHLASSIGKSDFHPTDQQIEVHELLKKQLISLKEQYNGLLNKDLADFNKLLGEKNISNIIVKTI